MSPERPPGVRPLFRFPWRTRRQLDAEVDEELRLHLEQVAVDLRAQGWSAADAMLEAQRQFGDLEFTRSYCRAEDIRRETEQRRMTIFDELKQDLGYALRSLRSAPGFTATALLTLALGIGANTAIFSVVRGVLMEPLPFTDPDRLSRIWHGNASAGLERAPLSEPDFLDWRAGSKLAESMGAYFYRDGLSGLDLTGDGNPERLAAALVTPGFFETLGTRAFIGRTIAEEEHVPGRDRVVVLSHGLWTTRFGSDPSIVGRSLTLNDEPFTVLGVMPAGFTYPDAQSLDAWIPLSFFGPESIGRVRGARFLDLIARPRNGVSQEQLQVELEGIAARLAREYPDDIGWLDVSAASIRESIVGDVRRPLTVLMVAVATLLLIACVNIASLLLARATVRQRELAVRAALGAGRARIARQFLTESLTLALLGGVLGVAFAFVAVRGLSLAGASELPRAPDIRVDGWALAFTVGVSVVCGLVFGIMPTIRAASGSLEQSLRSGARGSVGGGGQRMRSALVVVEVALAVVLVVGAGLATKSFVRLLSVNPGFDPSSALLLTMSIPSRYLDRDAGGEYYQEVLDAIRRVPGVRAAGSIRDVPFRGNGEGISFGLPGKVFAQGQSPTAQRHHISTDYFRAMGIPLLSGRSFESTDRAGAPLVIVVSEEFGRRYYPGEDATGKSIAFGETQVQIIGVVGDVRQQGLAEPVRPAMYTHMLQQLRARLSIVVRTSTEPLSYANAVRQAVWSVDPNQTITGVTTMEAMLGGTVARQRLLAWLLALFGIMGLTLGALGIFGVLAYAVSQRRQEIGVRVALGATPGSVLAIVVGRGMLLAGVGVATGLAGAALATSSMRSVLYGIEPSDPWTFVQVVLVLLVAALLASWLPARRALSIDPVTALRYD